MTTLLWFSRDLRLSDNPALTAAVARGQPVIPLFVLDDDDAGDWAPTGASRWWLHHSLLSLAKELQALGSTLVLRRGRAATVLTEVAEETRATAVYWNRRYEPWALSRNEKLKKSLTEKGLDVQSFNSALLREPWELHNKSGMPFRVFTPFWKTLRHSLGAVTTSPAPTRILNPTRSIKSDALAAWQLTPQRPDWASEFSTLWTPGEKGASHRLAKFSKQAVARYHERRNIPSVTGTSRLSPHLHFGEVGPRQIWRALTTQLMAREGNPISGGVETFLSEIAWREFSYHLLFHFPTLPHQPLRREFADFPWIDDPHQLRAWQRGATGYPIVDAGMRELWHTGWMHNRVRMIVASFLIKDLLINWQTGAAWFWDTLVDADLANNSASWQWVAGCGADAAPYFRIFNPSLQGVKFDPDGAYVRRWVPELTNVPAAFLHEPWAARPLDLSDVGVTLGKTYPFPLVDHAAARERALKALEAAKAKAPPHEA